MKARAKTNTRGFTIVELAVVIAIIGVLATITAVSYRNVQISARDAARRQSAQDISKSIQILFSRKNVQYIGGLYSSQPLDSNGLCQDESSTLHNQGGWVHDPDNYACDIGAMLEANNLMPPDFFDNFQSNEESLSSDAGTVAATMFYRCIGHDNTYVFYYHLTKPTDDETVEFDRVLQKCSTTTGNHQPSMVRDRYKMKAAIEMNLY